MELYHIIYTSTPVKQLNDDELKDLLHIARESNIRFDVTGMLVCLPDSYTQLLEGPRQHIDYLYDKIKRDNRQWQVTTLREGPVSARYFPDWAMTFEKQDENAADHGLVSTLDEKVLQLFKILES